MSPPEASAFLQAKGLLASANEIEHVVHLPKGGI